MKAVICSTIKNEEKNLNSFFKFLKKIISTFDDYYIILVESDLKIIHTKKQKIYY